MNVLTRKCGWRLPALVTILAVTSGRPVAAQVPLSPNTPTSPTAPSNSTWTGPLAGMLPAFLGDMAFNAPGGADHSGHFVRGLQTTVVALELGQALAAQVNTFPMVTPAGSFVFEGARGTGALVLTARAPIAAERATTLGAGQLATGLSFHRAKADAISGIDLDDGSINLYAPHNDCCGAGAVPSRPGNGTPAFERDVLRQTLGLELRQSVTALSVGYGVTSRIDLGVIVPLVEVTMAARVTSRIIRVATAATPSVHSFDGIDLANRTIARSGSAMGLGDVRLRGKYNLYRSDASAVAVSVDAALPTGDADNFLGSGGTRVRGAVILSADRGRLTPYLNAGYTRVSGTTTALASTWPGALDPTVSERVARTIPAEVDYAGGITFGAAPWMTFEAGVLGRTLLDAPRFAQGGSVSDEFVVDARGTVHRITGMAGARFRAGSRFLLTAGVVLPLADQGLRSKARPIVSLDYAF